MSDGYTQNSFITLGNIFALRRNWFQCEDCIFLCGPHFHRCCDIITVVDLLFNLLSTNKETCSEQHFSCQECSFLDPLKSETLKSTCYDALYDLQSTYGFNFF